MHNASNIWVQYTLLGLIGDIYIGAVSKSEPIWFICTKGVFMSTSTLHTSSDRLSILIILLLILIEKCATSR